MGFQGIKSGGVITWKAFPSVSIGTTSYVRRWNFFNPGHHYSYSLTSLKPSQITHPIICGDIRRYLGIDITIQNFIFIEAFFTVNIFSLREYTQQEHSHRLVGVDFEVCNHGKLDSSNNSKQSKRCGGSQPGITGILFQMDQFPYSGI